MVRLSGIHIFICCVINYCRTPLHFAIVRGHTEVVETLLEWKAAVNAADNDGKTPLLKVSSAYVHLSSDCISRFINIVQLLLIIF